MSTSQEQPGQMLGICCYTERRWREENNWTSSTNIEQLRAHWWTEPEGGTNANCIKTPKKKKWIGLLLWKIWQLRPEMAFRVFMATDPLKLRWHSSVTVTEMFTPSMNWPVDFRLPANLSDHRSFRRPCPSWRCSSVSAVTRWVTSCSTSSAAMLTSLRGKCSAQPAASDSSTKPHAEVGRHLRTQCVFFPSLVCAAYLPTCSPVVSVIDQTW